MVGCSQDRGRRRRRHSDLDDELEEGELAPGHHSASEDTADYYNRDYTSSGESEKTVSDCNTSSSAAAAAAAANKKSTATSAAAAANNNSGAASAAPASKDKDNAGPVSAAVAPEPLEPCPICGKEFRGHKAVCGHMKVHAGERPHGRPEQRKVKPKAAVGLNNVAVEKGWGLTGRRGFSGSGTTATSPNAEPDNSMAMVIAETKAILQPTPLAYAVTSPSVMPKASAKSDPSGEGSSAEPIVHNDATAIVVAGANPPTGAAAQQPAVPPPPIEGEQAQVVQQRRAAPTAAGAQNPEGYTCAVCGKWFATHQGLGGHVAGHKNRELAAAPCRSGAKPAKPHACRKCDRVFATGVQLGGHMRKHYVGRIVPKKKPRLDLPDAPPKDVEMPDLALSLPAFKEEEQSLAPAAMEAAPPTVAPAVERTPEPAPATAPVVRRVLLFGCDIGAAVQASQAQEGSPATKDCPSPGEGQ
ncbi:hypothetical protein ACP4OV_027526 [Aristida adscensionis]